MKLSYCQVCKDLIDFSDELKISFYVEDKAINGLTMIIHEDCEAEFRSFFNVIKNSKIKDNVLKLDFRTELLSERIL